MINYQVLVACAEYDMQRKTVGSRILYFWVEILYMDYIRGVIR
jgi:hypothetical protein